MQRYDNFLNVKCFELQKHFKIIHAENATNSGLSDLVAVQQFELLRAFVEIVAKRYAISPFLDFTALNPQLYIHRVTSLEHHAKR